MWLILPLVYVLVWKQTGSWRQAFHGTVAWILGYAAAAGTILALDVGGYDGVRATPDSPGAALAILGGFVGMWISNILWRRRGGDPPREHGKWERTFRAMFGGDQPQKKKRRAPAGPTARQQPPSPPPQHTHPQPVDAQYRPAPSYQSASAANPSHSGSQHAAASPQQSHQGPQQPQFAQQPPPQPQQTYPAQVQPVQRQSAGQARKPKTSRSSPTANKYAKATGRALGAMFRGSSKKSSPKNSQR